MCYINIILFIIKNLDKMMSDVYHRTILLILCPDPVPYFPVICEQRVVSGERPKYGPGAKQGLTSARNDCHLVRVDWRVLD